MVFRKLLRSLVIISVSVQTFVLAGNIGQWGSTIGFPLVPVAISLLHETGELIAWSAFSDNTFAVGKSGITQTAIYSPKTGKVTQYTVSNTGHDMFCPGISRDFNGRIIVTGGDTVDKTSINTGGDSSWVAGGGMVIPRGYQASATCSDGRIFTIGGSWSGGYGGKNGEIFDPNTNKWTLLSGCPVKPMLTNDHDGIFRQDSHAWLFGWKNGYVFQAGPSKNMNWYSTSGNGDQSTAGLRGDDHDAMNGNAIMYDAVAGKILTVGGAPDYQNANATANAHIITIGNAGAMPSVVKIGSMYSERSFANSVVLPDGKVFIIGGQAYAIPFTDTTPAMVPELFDPKTMRFTQVAMNPTPRTYHSVGLLMPDGTVFSGGGGLCGSTCKTNHFDGQLYSPPYLFKTDGVTRAARPQVKSISSTIVRIGGSITVTMQSAVSTFAMIRIGSSTHSIDTDQRRIPLLPKGNSLSYTITVPSDAGVAMPGYWMIFALDVNGVPSLAETVQVTL